MFKSTCGKCNGTGRLNWTQVDGGMCWACSGSGFFATKTDPKVLAARREASRAAKAADMAARVEEANARVAAREARYAADPRIGPATRARIQQFPAVGYETYKLLEQIDGGQSLPHVLRNISA